MNVLKKMSFLDMDRLAPLGLKSDEFNYQLAWTKVGVTFSDDDEESVHAFVLKCMDTRKKEHKQIGRFVFIKNKLKGYNYSLAGYEVNEIFFPDKMQRYYNLFLPVHSSIVLKLKEEQIYQ